MDMAHFKIIDSSALPTDQVELQAPNVMGGYREARRDEKYASRRAWEHPEQGKVSQGTVTKPELPRYTKMSPTFKTFILGGITGIIFTFSILAAIVGAGLATDLIIIIGFSCLLANAVVLSLTEFVTRRTRQVRYANERNQRNRSIREETDKNVLSTLYQAKGVSHEDATELSELFCQYRGIFVDLLLIEESGLVTKHENSLLCGLATFLSVIIFGSIPIGFYIGLLVVGHTTLTRPQVFLICCCATGLCLIILGTLKSLVSRHSWWLSGILTLLNGAVSGAAAYFIGYGLQYVFNLPHVWLTDKPL